MTALYEIRQIHDAWKNLKKTQKMSSIRASYLRPIKNGGQLKPRYQKSQHTKDAAAFIFHF
jgi:hypothetical protein